MPSYFLDSSALVKGYRVEVGTARINELLRSSEPLMIAQLSHLEVSSAIVRRASGSGKSAQEIAMALDELDREVSRSLELIRMDDSLIAAAIRFTRIHRLRAADAIQLASALLAFRHRSPANFVFVSADDELNAAAMAEGLQVENPNVHA